jgi:uncharacterized protein (DUF983 family)
MKRDARTLIEVVSRSMRLRCPACGQASIVNGPFRIRQSCPACGASFNREEGFFVGAILANVVSTEAVILLAYLVAIAFGHDIGRLVIAVMLLLAVTFPLAFYHHSWSLWLALDHLIESLPKPPAQGGT